VSLCGTNGEGSQSTDQFTPGGTARTYQASFGDLTAGDYTIWLHMGASYNWYSMEQSVTVSGTETITFAIPTLHTARGQVSLSDKGTLPENL
ncbi:MAG: hypothetical protein RR336_12250, partial [Oscillospiraceae bacterium]